MGEACHRFLIGAGQLLSISRAMMSGVGLLRLGRVTLTQSLDDESEVDKSQKHNIEFLEAKKNASKAFWPAKEAFYFVPYSDEGHCHAGQAT